MPDLRPATRDELLHTISYGLRYDRRGKAHGRNAEMMATLAAEALIELLERAGYVILKKPASPAPEARDERMTKLKEGL